jgi:uncharacterized UPF0160 family protein
MKIKEIIERIKKGECTEVTLVTHSSNPRFHTDDVSATALLELLFVDKYGIKTELVKTFKPAEEGYTDDTVDCVVYDIGLGQYDHHQVGEEANHVFRPDGGKYASVGLIWREVGTEFVSDEKHKTYVYESLIKYIDDADNGVESNPLTFMIRQLNCPPNRTNGFSNTNEHEFIHAVTIMKTLFRNLFYTIDAEVEEHEDCLKAIKTSNGVYVATETYISSMVNELTKENIPFYIYPNSRGGYCFRAIPKEEGSMNNHIINIPDEVRTWDGVTFLHPSCFLGSAESKEKAIEVVTRITSEN